jgi:hypothetical protein
MGSNAAMMGKMRRLWPVILTFLVIAVVCTVTATMIERAMSAYILQREAEVAQEFLRSVLIAEDSFDKLFEEPVPSPALQSFGHHLEVLPEIVRANVYSPDGFIRFSTERNLIGVKFGDNPELQEAFAGHLVTGLEEISDNTKDEHLALNRTGSDTLVEAYIPVTDKAGRLAGVVEFYRLPTRVTSAIESARRIIWLVLAAGGLVLFLAAWLLLLRSPQGGPFRT